MYSILQKEITKVRDRNQVKRFQHKLALIDPLDAKQVATLYQEIRVAR